MRLSLTWAVAATILANLACGSRVHGGTDGSTHFWDTCANDSECGSRSECICGRCTTECNSDEQCAGSDVVCVAASSRLDCSREGLVCAPEENEPPRDGNDASIASLEASSDAGAQTFTRVNTSSEVALPTGDTSTRGVPSPGLSTPDLDAGTPLQGRCLDTANCPWTSLTRPPFEYAALTAVHDSKLYVFYGAYRVPIVDAGPMSTGNEEPSAIVNGNFVYDVATNQWSTLATPADNVRGPSAEVIDNEIYVVRADGKLAVYDIAGDSWAEGAPPPERLTGAGTHAVAGLLYLFGGTLPFPEGVSTGGVSEENFSTYVYTPATNTWNTVANAPESAKVPASCALDNRLFVFGEPKDTGNESAAPGTTLIYDTTSDKWTTGAPQQTFGYDQSCVTIGNELYVFGGSMSGGTPLDRVSRYSPDTDNWTEVATLPGPTWSAAQVVGDAAYVLGYEPPDDSPFWRFSPQP